MANRNRTYEWDQVRKALAERNWDFDTLARALATRMKKDGYTRGYVYNIVSGLPASPKTRQAVEEILNLPRGTITPRGSRQERNL
jgi:hypothetical protein